MSDLRGKCKLDHKTYMDTKKLIRSYPSLVEEYNAILHASPTQDGMPKSNAVNDLTGNMVVRLMELGIKIDSIYKALLMLPEYYRMPIFDHIVYKRPVDVFVSDSTTRRWQYRYIYHVYTLLEEKKKFI